MTDPAVAVGGLRKTYGDRVAVDEVSFSVASGEIFGILGPNGAGKTTIVESVAGLRVGDAGSVRVHDLDPWTEHDRLKRLLGIQLQEAQLPDRITVREALELWTSFYADPAPWSYLAERVGLEDHLGQRFGKLSGGQQQRLSIALALVGRPRVAILDELSTGLDPRARRQMWDLVRAVRDEGTTVLLVTHAMDEAQQLCDRIAIVQDGRVVASGTPDELIGSTTAATVTSFRADGPIDLESLRELPGVRAVHTDVGRVFVHGVDGAAIGVLDELRRNDVSPQRLRIADNTLDAAYLEFTAGLATDLATDTVEGYA